MCLRLRDFWYAALQVNINHTVVNLSWYMSRTFLSW